MEFAHLHNHHELTFKLMDDPTRWRERVVEKIVIEDADDVRVTSSYQIRLPLGLVQGVWPSCGSGDLVRILLPLTTRPKGVLLDVDLKGTEGHHCALLLKHQLARLQANFVRWVANAPPGESLASMDADEVLYAISAYSPTIWNQHVAELRNESPQTLAEYLRFGLRLDIRLDDVRHWSELVAPASELLAASMGTAMDLQSAVAHVPRCLPFVEHRPATVRRLRLAWPVLPVRGICRCSDAVDCCCVWSTLGCHDRHGSYGRCADQNPAGHEASVARRGR